MQRCILTPALPTHRTELNCSSKKDDPTYDVLYYWESSKGEGSGSPRSISTGDTSLKDTSARDDKSSENIKPIEQASSMDTISMGDELDVPTLLEDNKRDGELTLTKRKVCRTDVQTTPHVDFLSAFPTGEAEGEPPSSPRVLRAMKTIAVVPERGQLHSDKSEIKSSSSTLRETRSFDTGTQGKTNP